MCMVHLEHYIGMTDKYNDNDNDNENANDNECAHEAKTTLEKIKPTLRFL